jgi:glutaminyl-peptide cyclotransferase
MTGKFVDPFAVRIRQAGVPYFRAEVLRTIPHDPVLLTEGLCAVPGGLLESTGGYGQSMVLRYDFSSADVLSTPAPAEVFGEGICRLGDTAWQLTYQERLALAWRVTDLTLLRQVPYDRDGWGLGTAEAVVYSTDGSSALTLRDPESLAAVGQVVVKLGSQSVAGLHDLTVTESGLWITKTRSHWLIRVEPATGEVTGAANLRRAFHDVAGFSDWGVTAISAAEGPFWTTGKHYPYLIQVSLQGDDSG